MKSLGAFKIRTLPRSNENEHAPSFKASPFPRWVIYVGAASVFLLLLTLLWPSPQPSDKSKMAKMRVEKVLPAEPAASAKAQDAVDRYIVEAQMKRRMMERTREFENLGVKLDAIEGLDPMASSTDYDAQKFGVQLDQEDSADRVYQDLNQNTPGYSDALLNDKINSRLANRRWVNDLERNQRISFVKNFIRSAYERGYEVQLNDDLVVVGVKKITGNKTVNIDQVIDKLAEKGL